MKKFFIICLLIIVITFAFANNFVLAEEKQNYNSEDLEKDYTSENLEKDYVSEEPNKESTTLDNPIGVTTVEGVIAKIIRIFLGIIGVISLVMFIYGGIMILTSAGDETRIKTGKETLIWASLGILLVFAAYAILRFVLKVLAF